MKKYASQIRKGQRRSRESELNLLAMARRSANASYVTRAAGFWLNIWRMHAVSA